VFDGRQQHPETESALEQVEEAERRLEERSVERGHERERILARRARRERWQLPLRVSGLGALGALVFLATIQTAGGDLSGVPNPLATLIVAALLLAPAAVGAWLVRAEGWPFAVAVGVCVFAIELVLAIGVGFVLLGLGPDY
jgi:hypothetical protein